MKKSILVSMFYAILFASVFVVNASSTDDPPPYVPPGPNQKCDMEVPTEPGIGGVCITFPNGGQDCLEPASTETPYNCSGTWEIIDEPPH